MTQPKGKYLQILRRIRVSFCALFLLLFTASNTHAAPETIGGTVTADVGEHLTSSAATSTTTDVTAFDSDYAGGIIYDNSGDFTGTITNTATITVDAAGAAGIAVGVGFIGSVSLPNFTFANIDGSVIGLGDITATGLKAVGFRAGDVSNATIDISSITATGGTGTGGAAAGFWVENVTNSTINLGAVNVKSQSTANGGDMPIGVSVAGTLTNGTFITSDITVDRSAGGGGACGFVVENGADGTVVIDGAIKITGSGGARAAGNDAVGVHSTYFTDIVIKNSINVAGSKFDTGYGIITHDIQGNTVSDSNVTIDTAGNDKLSITGTTAGIKLGGANDTLTITGTNPFTNDGKGFVFLGVETLNIKTDTVFYSGSVCTSQAEGAQLTTLDIADGKSVTFNIGAYFGLVADNNTSTNEITIGNGSTLQYSWAEDKNANYVTRGFGGIISVESTASIQNALPIDIGIDGGILKFVHAAPTGDNASLNGQGRLIETGYNLHVGSKGAEFYADGKNGKVTISSVDGDGGFLKSGGASLFVDDAFSIAGTLQISGGTLVLGNQESYNELYDSASRIVIEKGSLLQITPNSMVELTNTDNTGSTYDDIIIRGNLTVYASEHTGIYKSANPGHEMYITVDGGFIGIIIDGEEDGALNSGDVFAAETIHSKIGKNGGEIHVEDVIFHAGNVIGTEGGNLTKTGDGTYRVGTMNLNGTLSVLNGNVELTGDADIEELLIEEGKSVIGDNVHRLTLANGGTIYGYVKDIGEFNLKDGILELSIHNNDPTIIADKLVLGPTAQIKAGYATRSGTYENVIKTNMLINPDYVTQLNKSVTALYRPKWSLRDDEKGLDLDYRYLSLPEYMDEKGKGGGNAGNIGDLIDTVADGSGDLRDALDGLSDAELDAVLRSALGGELVGNALRFAMWQPYRHVFRHLDEAAPLRSPFTYHWGGGYQPPKYNNSPAVRGQQPFEGFHLWFNSYAASERAKDDWQTYDGYKLTRGGFLLGGDLEIYNYAVAGLVFAYGKPSVSNDLGKISADDYTVGLYMRTPIFCGIAANMMAGYGDQSYLYKNSFNQKTKYHGNSVYASLELSKEWSFVACHVKPVLALDYQKAMTDSFAADLPVLGGMTYEASGLDWTAIRLGVDSKWWRMRSRLQYVHLLSGEGSVVSQTMLRDYSAIVRSAEWGTDWLNFGLGGEVITTRHWRVFADYDLDVGKNTASHTGSFNTVLTW